MLTSSCAFLWGPTFYFYIRSVTEPEFELAPRHLIHLLPFLAAYVYVGELFIFQSAEFKTTILVTGSLSMLLHAPIFNSIQLVQLFAYLIAAYGLLQRYQNELKKYYSSVHRKNYAWLKFFYYGYGVKYLFDVVYVVNNFTPVPHMDALMFTIFSLLLIFIIVIVYKALTEPYLFSDPAIVKYESSLLTEDQKTEYLKKVTAYMKSEKPYLDPELTIGQLSEKLSIPRRYVSQIINENLRQNFFDFVNSYRIQEAKTLLAASSSTKKNILEILFDAGFNSKSVFNAAFKKHTSMTPRQFKNSVPS
jgi:AraC-like DNA-binding protein